MGRVTVGFVLLVLLVLLTAGCSADPAPEAATAPSTSASGSAAPPVADPPVTGPVLEGVVGDKKVRVTLDGVTVAGDVALLDATVEMLESGEGLGVLGATFSNAARLGLGVDEPRLVDLAAGNVHNVAENAEGRCVCTRGALDLDPGKSTPVQLVFAAPTAGVDRVAVLWPHLGLAVGVPVTVGTLPTPHAPDTDAGTTAPDPGDVASALVATLESYTQTPDESLRTRESNESLTVELAADVLFAVDSADVEPGAAQALNLAVASVRARGPGKLSVVGHTDDTADEAYNLDLSRRRAQSVATAVAGSLDPADYPVTVDGRGEAEPAVPGASVDARRLNRRVTLVHVLDDASAAKGSSAGPAGPPPPPTAGVVGTGGEGVQVVEGKRAFRVRTPEARRVGGVLVVDLEVRVESAEPTIIGGLFASGAFSARGGFDAFSQFSSVGVRLVDAATQTYSLDYVVGAPRRPDDLPPRTCLCDRWQNVDVPPGVTNTITVVFPDPGPDATSVVIEVEDTFRLTDVAVR